VNESILLRKEIRLKRKNLWAVKMKPFLGYKINLIIFRMSLYFTEQIDWNSKQVSGKFSGYSFC